MTRIFLFVAIIAFASVAAAAQSKYDTYINERFSFSIDYPSDLLTMQPPPTNGDGRAFLSKDGNIELQIWANYNALFHSVEQECAWSLENLKNVEVTYKKVADSWFVVSGTSNGKIYYQKTLYHKFKNTDVFFTFTLEYPKSQKRRFDPVVRRIENSFKFDPNANV